MRTVARFIIALTIGLSALVSDGALQALFTGCYFEPDGSWHYSSDGRITPLEGGTIYSEDPDEAVDFVAHAPANSGLRVQYWFMFKVSEREVSDGPPVDTAETKRMGEYSDSLSVSWNTNHFFYDVPVYVCARFYYMTNTVSFYKVATTATGSMTNIGPQCYTNSYSLTPCGFELTGYTFSNWTNEVGASFSDGQLVSGSALGVTNNNQEVKLYAVWSSNPYTITYNLDGGTHGSAYAVFCDVRCAVRGL